MRALHGAPEHQALLSWPRRDSIEELQHVQLVLHAAVGRVDVRVDAARSGGAERHRRAGHETPRGKDVEVGLRGQVHEEEGGVA